MNGILLSGSAGFLGSMIAKRLDEMRWKYTGIDSLKFGNIKNVSNKDHFRHIDIADMSELDLSQYDTLIAAHTANIIFAQTHCSETMKNNAVDTGELFERFKGKIIYISTSSVYGNPKVIPTPETADIELCNPYDISKYAAEQMLRWRGNYTIIRPANIYGVNQRLDNVYCGVVPRFINAAMNKKPMQIYGIGESSRDYNYVDNVVDAVIAATWKDSFNAPINIASGIEVSIKELAILISEIMDVPVQLEYVEGRKIDNITRRCLDISKAEKLLGWTPKVGLREGLERTIEWMKKEVETSEKIIA